MNFNENKLEEQTTNPDSVPKKKKIQTQINWNSLKHSPTHNKHKPNYTKINPNQTNQPIKINQRINLNQVINPQIWKCENNYKNRPKNQRTNSDLRTCWSTSIHCAPTTTAPTWETTTPTVKINPKIITNLVTVSQIKLNPTPSDKEGGLVSFGSEEGKKKK